MLVCHGGKAAVPLAPPGSLRVPNYRGVVPRRDVHVECANANLVMSFVNLDKFHSSFCVVEHIFCASPQLNSITNPIPQVRAMTVLTFLRLVLAMVTVIQLSTSQCVDQCPDGRLLLIVAQI